MSQSTALMIVGFGPDEPGIAAAMLAPLKAAGLTITDSAMTILRGVFTYNILVESATDTAALAATYEALAREKGWSILCRPVVVAPEKAVASDTPVMISVAGADQVGITLAFAELLAQQGVNITDLYAKQCANKVGTVYILMIEADLPASLDRDAFEDALIAQGEALQVEVTYQPIDVLAL